MKKIVFALLCSFTGLREIKADKVDWCSLTCHNGEQNTMCKYKPQINAGYCKNIEKATTEVMRKELLRLHNEYRNKIASGKILSNGVTWPNASNMRQMSWDYNLEKLAYRWVQQCVKSPAHDKCRRTPEFKENGQNLGWSSSTFTAPPAEGTFYAWVSEISKTTQAIVDKLPSDGGMMHFTQVIWYDTFKLGCAAIHADKDGMKASILACNYGPTGNIIGGRVYQRGDPCSHCPPQTSCRPDSEYPHLCALTTDGTKPEDIDDPPDDMLPVHKPAEESTTESVDGLSAKPSTEESPRKPNGSCKLNLFGMKQEDPMTLISLLSTIMIFLVIKMPIKFYITI